MTRDAETTAFLSTLVGRAEDSATSFIDSPEVFLFLMRRLADGNPAAFNGMHGDALILRIQFVIGHPFFRKLSHREQEWIIRVAHYLLQHCAPTADTLFRFGHLLSEIFPDLVRSPELTDGQKIHFYEICRNYLGAVPHEAFGLRFGSHVLRPLAKDIEERYPGTGLAEAKPGAPRTFAYIAHWPSFRRGNGIGCLIVPAAVAHSRLVGDHGKVVLYCVNSPTPEVIDYIGDAPLQISILEPGPLYSDEALERIRGTLVRDKVDVAITELNSGLALYLFKRRCAHLQLWLETGQPFWPDDSLDAALSFREYQSFLGIEPDRLRYVRFRLDVAALCREPQPGAVESIRKTIPADKIVVGIVSRLVKLSFEYIVAVARIVQENDNAFLLLAGGGPVPPWGDWLRKNLPDDRYRIVPELVDMDTYGRVLDVFLDSHPMFGGNAAREAMYFGRPVVAMQNRDFRRYFTSTRDPDLLVEDWEAYVKVAGRLLQDPVLLGDKRAKALEISEDDRNVRAMALDIAREIEILWKAGCV